MLSLIPVLSRRCNEAEARHVGACPHNNTACQHSPRKGLGMCMARSVVTLQGRQSLTWVWSQLCSYKQNDFANPSHLLSLSFPWCEVND